jgi:3-phosphoshikimate 1-carboxyvinyltransferase
MLRAFGAELVRDGTMARLAGRGPDACPLTSPGRLHVPGDPSSAAFPLVAALLHADGLVRAEAISGNPTRLGFVRVLQRMGARLAFEPTATEAGEPVGALIARSSSLIGVDVAAEDVPACIDELPILALCAAAATGTSRFHGVAELRVKESDRLAATLRLLVELGVHAEAADDTLIVHGLGCAAFASLAAPFDPGHDHRMAMTAAVAGMVGPHPVRVRGFATVASSFPEFGALMRTLAH